MATERQQLVIMNSHKRPMSKELGQEEVERKTGVSDFTWAYLLTPGITILEISEDSWAIYRGKTLIFEGNFEDTLNEVKEKF